MKKPFYRMIMPVIAAAAFTVSAFPAQEEPIMTFHTRVKEEAGTSNLTFYLGAKETTYVDVDCGYGSFETEVNYADYDEEAGEIVGTPVTCNVSADGVVKVYGDPSLIDFIDLEGVYADNIEWPQMTNVEILNLKHNKLQSLDLAHMTRLNALYLSDNPGSSVSPIKVGGPKPDLLILEAAMIDWFDPDFDMTLYPALRVFSAYSTRTLTNVDPSKCPDLLQLSLDATGIESIDVTENKNLLILNVSETMVTSIDLSENTQLREFYCQHEGFYSSEYKFNTLDISNNPNLVRLYVNGNNLTELNLRNALMLESFGCRDNYIKELDFTGMKQLTLVDVSQNLMNFNTCPLPSIRFSDYVYNQRPLILNRSYKVGTTLDLTDAVVRDDSETTVELYSIKKGAEDSPMLLGNDYYSYDNGKITLLQESADSLYFAFKTTVFPDWTLTTQKFLVKSEEDFGKPVPRISMKTSMTAKEQSLKVGLLGATPENPKEFMVDFGDGKPVTFTATSEYTPLEANAVGKRAGSQTILYTSEDDFVTAFSISDMRLSNIDLSGASSLEELEVTGCSLTDINLDWNNRLRSLNLSRNQLTDINLVPESSQYLKNMLGDINLADNQLTGMTLVDNYGIKNLNVANNKLQDINLTHMTGLLTLNVAGNALSEVSLTDCEVLKELDLSANNLTEIAIPDYVVLDKLDISGNKFNFSTLPLNPGVKDYTYAPQQLFPIAAKGPMVNLRTQSVILDGNETRFEWHRLSDDSLIPDSNFEYNNGIVRFLDTNLGDIYCLMTNAAFPQFAGELAMRTTPVLTAEPPTNLIVQFTTLEDAKANLSLAANQENASIFVDWTGDGVLELYDLTTSYRLFEARTSADTKVRCYSYDEVDPVTVFSISGTPLKDFDASGMKSAVMVGVRDAGLQDGSLILPTCPTLTEVALDGNNLTTFDTKEYTHIKNLSMMSNQLTSLDLSPLKELQNFYASYNSLSEITLDNPKLWELALVGNELTEIDLSKTPAMEQLWLDINNIERIDVSAMPGLRVLTLSGNRFNFNTLPRPDAKYYLYSYANQQPIEISLDDNFRVDLSEYEVIGSVETEYTWYQDSPAYDEDGNLVGKTLVEGEDYELEYGVITFKVDVNNVMCVMTNATYPDLLQYTTFIDVRNTGVEAIGENDSEAEYFDLNGLPIARPTEKGIYLKRTAGKTSKELVR